MADTCKRCQSKLDSKAWMLSTVNDGRIVARTALAFATQQPGETFQQFERRQADARTSALCEASCKLRFVADWLEGLCGYCSSQDQVAELKKEEEASHG